MRVCGVDIKSNEARLAIVEDDGPNGAKYIGCNTRKIQLGDDKEAASIRAFLSAITTFAHEHNISVFAIKARAQRGKMAGGAVSFKIETLIQLVDDCTCELINAVALSGFAKKNVAGLPGDINTYQADAYRCAAFVLHKTGLI